MQAFNGRSKIVIVKLLISRKKANDDNDITYKAQIHAAANVLYYVSQKCCQSIPEGVQQYFSMFSVKIVCSLRTQELKIYLTELEQLTRILTRTLR